MPYDDIHYFIYFLFLAAKLLANLKTGSEMSVIQAQVDYNDGGMLKV